MKTTFSLSARYERHAMAAIALLLRETARDADCRSDDDVQIQKFGPVSDSLYDADATGLVMITVEVDSSAPVPVVDGSHYEVIGESLERQERTRVRELSAL